MTNLTSVIFDLDGCLVDSEPLSLEVIAAQMRSLGIADADAQEIGDQFLGVSMSEIVRHASRRLGGPVPDDFSKRVEDQLLSTYETELTLIPDAKVLLRSLAGRGVTMGIATGGSLRRMTTTLRLSGLAAWFEGTACSAEEVNRGKPAPDLFILTTERLNADPARCMVVEDSPHGIKGAIDAGIAAVGFVGGSHLEGKRDAHGEKLRAAGAAAVFDSLGGIERYILERVP